MKKFIFILLSIFLIATPLWAEGNDANTILLLHCNGDDEAVVIPDTSVGGNGGATHGNATVVANAQLDTAQKVFGTASLLLDGTDDRITFADHADWDWGTGAWTIDCHVMFDTTTASRYLVSHFKDDTNRWIFGWYNGATDHLQFYCNIAGTDQGGLSDAWTPTDDTWYHLAVSRSGNTIYFFVDGVAKGSIAFNQDIPDMTGVLGIGARQKVANWAVFHHGWIDELRISNVARWTEGFDVSTEEYSAVVGAQVFVTELQ